MPNFKDNILEVAGDESIQSIVVNKGRDWRREKGALPDGLYDTPVEWDAVAPYLDYEYDAGYGGEDCHAIYAYTETRVLLVSMYDGSTWVVAIPRHPVAGEPQMVGGG